MRNTIRLKMIHDEVRVLVFALNELIVTDKAEVIITNADCALREVKYSDVFDSMNNNAIDVFEAFVRDNAV